MKDKSTPLTNALLFTIEVEKYRNVKARVVAGVIQRCLDRCLLCKDDKQSNSKKYRWVCKVIDNDYSALCLLRKENLKVRNRSDLSVLISDIDDMCEEIIIRIAKRILERKIELK